MKFKKIYVWTVSMKLENPRFVYSKETILFYSPRNNSQKINLENLPRISVKVNVSKMLNTA